MTDTRPFLPQALLWDGSEQSSDDPATISRIGNAGLRAGGDTVTVAVVNDGAATDVGDQRYEGSGSSWVTPSDTSASSAPSLSPLFANGASLSPGGANTSVTSAEAWPFSTTSDTGLDLILPNAQATQNGSAVELDASSYKFTSPHISGWTTGV